MDDNYTIGDEIEHGRHDAVRTILSWVSQIIYIVAVLYAEVHGYSLLKAGIEESLLAWAMAGMVALGVTAIALPFALKYKFYAPVQRYMGFAFYVVDLGLLIFNAMADYARNTDGSIPGWMMSYMLYVVPITPVIVGIGWSILELLDPAARERVSIETIKASTRIALFKKAAAAARSQDIDERVRAAGEKMMDDIVAQTLGIPVYRSKSNLLPTGKGSGTGENKNGHNKPSMPKRIWDRIAPLKKNGHSDDEEVVISIDRDTGQVDISGNR